MRGRMIRCAPLLAACGCALPLLAQSGPPAATPERPRFYVFGTDGVPCQIVPDAANDFQTAAVTIGVNETNDPESSEPELVALLDDRDERVTSFLPLDSAVRFTDRLPALSRGADLDGSGFWHIDPTYNTQTQQWASERRWGGVKQWAFGDVDSPVIYPLPVQYNFWLRSRQRNAYARKIGTNQVNIPEMRHEVGLRLHRRELEASEAGYRLDAGGRLMMPWVHTVGLRIDESQPPILMSSAELSQTLALVRSKRVQEAMLFNSHPFNSQEATDSWIMTGRAVKDVYSPSLSKITYSTSNGTDSNTDSAGDLALLNDTLLGTNDAPRTFDVTSHQVSNGSHALKIVLEYKDLYPIPNQTNDLRRLVNGETIDGEFVRGRDFFVNVECTAYLGHSNYDTAATNVTYTVYSNRNDDTLLRLSSFDGEGQVSSGRNTFGNTRCYWHIPNSEYEDIADRVDPSIIVIEASAPAAFRVRFDLVQVIPYKVGQATIVGEECVPEVDLSVHRDFANALPVDGAVFQSGVQNGGFKVRWSQPIIAEQADDNGANLYMRVYSATGDWRRPLVDITCKTEQTLGYNADFRNVYIRYRPNPNQSTKPLPPGKYTFCTVNCATDINAECGEVVYPQLRTDLDSDIENDPPVPSEYFVIRVEGSTGAPTDCDYSPNCTADVDDGSMTGTFDGGVTIDDLLFYLWVFEAGTLCADTDDGSFTGTLDGGVTIDDLLYYLQRFEAGC